MPQLPALARRELDAQPFDGLWLLQTSAGRQPSLTAYKTGRWPGLRGNGL